MANIIKLKNAMKKRNKALALFTTTMKQMEQAQVEVEDFITEVECEEELLKTDKDNAKQVLAENKAVLENIKKFIGGAE